MATFRPLSPTLARWRAWEGDGLEQASLRPAGNGVAISSVVIGTRNGNEYGVHYAFACNPDWTIRSLDLETVDGQHVAVRSDSLGTWTDASGRHLPEFDGCDGIDLEGTPITNTLALRRLDPGDRPVEQKMLYVPFDSFVPFLDEQRYSCLDPGRRYRYEAVDGSFEAEIEVDGDGLVVSYPPLFHRVPLS
ncbi:MAG: putative glycolipid-binding domain-containing protein [Bauldia sp.]|nr:putative glycolipid-binding domain-containing protein [Bauldia sp.]